MPRDGSGVASKPAGTTAASNTTIESAKFNSVIDDIYTLLNTALPVTAGGTGETTAIGAADALFTKSTDIASASTTDLSTATGMYAVITGTTTITAFGTEAAGVTRALRFSGALTLTHNATSLILPGAANITTAAGDTAIMVSEGSGNWRCVVYQRVSGTTALPVAKSASGTSVDFTSVPSWVREITVSFYTVSTSGSSFLLVQIGDAGGVETSGYTGSCTSIVTSVPPVNTGISTGFGLRTGVAASSYSGSMTLTKHDAVGGDYWVASGLVSDVGGDLAMGSGGKVLTALLDRVRVTTVNGTDTFDGGSLNVLYK